MYTYLTFFSLACNAKRFAIAFLSFFLFVPPGAISEQTVDAFFGHDRTYFLGHTGKYFDGDVYCYSRHMTHDVPFASEILVMAE